MPIRLDSPGISRLKFPTNLSIRQLSEFVQAENKNKNKNMTTTNEQMLIEAQRQDEDFAANTLHKGYTIADALTLYRTNAAKTMNASELSAGLRILLTTENCDEAIRAVAAAIKSAGIEVEITEDNGSPDALNDDETLWVTSSHELVIDGETVAEWIRCAMGTYGEAGRQCSDDEWCVSEDTNGGDILPENVAVALEALGLEDSLPDVPAPELATDAYEPDADGEFCVFWETVGDDAHLIERYTTHEAAAAVCHQKNREFSARNPSGGGTTYLCGFSVRSLARGRFVVRRGDRHSGTWP